MPRVAHQPTGKGRTATKQAMATPHQSSPVKLVLNDDHTEKAARLKNRQALHDIQMNQIKAAASPMRKMNGYENNNCNNRGTSSSPQTPRSAANIVRDRNRDRGKENNDPHSASPGMLNVVSNSAVTPMKRVPILANFEEWMKMATDNKINATNSWNFALIDYFHDLSLLKEGDGVNFQKASCTLDGCVKIYTSRVDSVASETGKLLSGLADSGGGKKGREKEEGGEDGESGDEEGEDGVRKKAKKKTQRSHEQTLAPSFASLQLKKLELEFAVDPLFKKASADFDEGGAKGLLLNHLSIDSEGRIVFDSSDDTADVKSYPNTTQMQQTLVDPTATLAEDVSNLSLLPDNNQIQDQEIDLSSLASKFFPDLSILDSQDICPSMKSFTLGDPNSDLNMPFLKAPEDWRESHKSDDPDRPLIDIPLGDRSGIFLDSENAAGFDDDDDDEAGGPLGGFDIGPDVGFGEGGEAWAKDAALEPMLRVARADDPSTNQEGADGIVVGDFDPANPNADAYAVGLNHQRGLGDADPTDNILSYFDAALKSTKAAAWAGPEHWRIRKIKAAQKSSSDNPAPVRTRKEKEPFEIDFLAPMDQCLADMLYTPASSNAAICLPKAQWKTEGRNLLPDDRHFNSRSLLQLWIKPKARVGRRRVVPGLPDRGFGSSSVGQMGDEAGDGGVGRHVEMDEAYWARRREEEEARRREDEEEQRERREGDYDANFFADDDAALPFGGGLPPDDVDDDDDGVDGQVGFTDAREMLSPPPTTAASMDSQQQQPPPPPPPPGFDPALLSSQPPSHLLPGSFGSQLVTQAGRRLRPEYVNYARVAKKVDVRRLKENMWSGMSAELMSVIAPSFTTEAEAEKSKLVDDDDDNRPPTPAPTDPGHDMDMDVDTDTDGAATKPDKSERPGGGRGGTGSGNGKELKFTSLIRSLTKVYPETQMRDISTSYCFICLLHLANEKGLVLEGDYPPEAEGGRDGLVDGRGVGRGLEQQQGGGKEGRLMGMWMGMEKTGLMREIRVRRDESVGVGYVGE